MVLRISLKLLIVDDHEVVRSGLATMLARSNVEIVGEASSGAEAVAMAVDLAPDVVLLDIRMPGIDGLQVLEQIREKAPDVRVVMLSNFDNPAYMSKAVGLGASNYLLKGASREEILESITAAGRGEETRSEPLRRSGMISEARRNDLDDGVSLTSRETEVLRCIAQGQSNKEISRTLDISVETVKEHVQNLLRKLHLTDRTQAAVWAVRRKLV